MNVIKTPIEGILVIESKVFSDDRGHFFESWSQEAFEREGLNLNFVQDNQSLSAKGVLRGLHFQNPPFAQGKLVSVITGSVMDVVVDIRRDSKTFGHWIGEYLNDKNRKQFWIPPGLAHGFVVISEYADLYYKLTQYYDPADEGRLIWDDDDVGIKWPVKKPLLSKKDQKGLSLKDL